jgi:hypothetical protein
MAKESYKYLYSIFDNTTKLFEPPFVDINNGSALRRIQDLMQSNPTSPYAKFPDDFSLMCLGTWNDETGHIYTDAADLVQPLNKIIPKE